MLLVKLSSGLGLSPMARAVRQSPRSSKWNVVQDDGQIHARGVSEVIAKAEADRLTKEGEVMTTFAEWDRWDWYRVNAPELLDEARSRFTPEADLGAVVRYADYLRMPKADRDVADFWAAWIKEGK